MSAALGSTSVATMSCNNGAQEESNLDANNNNGNNEICAIGEEKIGLLSMPFISATFGIWNLPPKMLLSTCRLDRAFLTLITWGIEYKSRGEAILELSQSISQNILWSLHLGNITSGNAIRTHNNQQHPEDAKLPICRAVIDAVRTLLPVPKFSDQIAVIIISTRTLSVVLTRRPRFSILSTQSFG